MNSLSDAAVSAGNCYRALELLIGEFERISAEDPRGINLFDRFLILHREFYDNIIILTSEDSWEIDREFEQEVLEEYRKLSEIVQSLKNEKWFLQELAIKLTWRTNAMADYFARCVDDILNWYGIDPDSNEIFIICDEWEEVLS